MENTMYFMKMYQEFKKANGMKGGIEDLSKYQDMFIDWLEAKAKASNNYGGLIYDIGIEEDSKYRRVVEFDKGLYDTATIRLSELLVEPPVVISPYARSLEKLSGSGIELAEGRLVNSDSDVFVSYQNASDYFESPNCSTVFGDDIGTMLTQMPFTKDDIKPLLLALKNGKTIFLGADGMLDDKDKEENIQRILFLYEQLQAVDFIDSSFESTTMDNSYLATVKATPRVKRYVKVKTK